MQQDPQQSEIEAALIKLITSDVGYGISLFVDLLLLWPVADGRFAVSEADFEHNWTDEKIFATAAEAVAFFEERRRERQLGWDFERDPSHEDG